MQTRRSAQRLANPASAKRAPEWWSWADIIRHADQLGIPNFQRGAVWDSGNRTALLESIYEQSPCGSFVLWAPDDAPDSSRRHGVPLRGFAADVQPKWLVDGQQRTRAMLDTFQELMGLPGDSRWQLVRKADIDELRGHGMVLLNAGDGLLRDSNPSARGTLGSSRGDSTRGTGPFGTPSFPGFIPGSIPGHRARVPVRSRAQATGPGHE